MAPNRLFDHWRVKVTYLPATITVEALAQVFRFPASRIHIPELQSFTTYYAWINGFDRKEDADDFALRNSKLIISHSSIKCTVHARASSSEWFRNGAGYCEQ